MIKLLRGDDAKHLISLDLPEVAFSEGMTVIFEIGGLKITAPAAPSIEVQFPSTWTALQPCGRLLGSWKIRDRNGNVGTLTKTFPVYLTDDVGETTSGSIVSGNVKPVVDFSDIAELTTSATPGDIKEALNEILKRLKTGLNCLLIALAIPAFSAELTPDTIMDNVPGYATISNVVTAAGVTVGGGTDGAAVTNIVNGIVKGKRDYKDLSYTRDGETYWKITDGEDVVKLTQNESGSSYYGSSKLFWYMVTEKMGNVDFELTLTKGSVASGMIIGQPMGKASKRPIISFNLSGVEGAKKTVTPDFIALKSEVIASTNALGETINEISSKASDAYSLAGDVATLVYGDDCQLVSTNYNSETKMPSLFLRFKIKDETTGEMAWYKVWDELTRWDWLFDNYMPSNYYTKAELDTELDQKADRAWGNYDSTTGNYAPEGFTWISSPSIAIAGGLAYQRILTTEGAVWVLESNGMTTFTGGETNGFFRISDDKGNALFEITKGTEKVVGATANATRTESIDGVTHLFITYNVASAEPPKLEICRKLTRDTAPDWKLEDDDNCPARVSWTGSSGAWIAEVYGKTAEPSLFVKGTYKQGAKDMIKNSAPVSFTEIVIDGVTYKVKVETMNGKKVLVLE